MNWKSLINDKSRLAFCDLAARYPEGPKNFELDRRDYEYTDIRQRLLQIDKECESSTRGSAKRAYAYDLEFALRLYGYFDSLKFGIWQAADNGIWAHISIQVIPDIVYKRWGGYNEDRFYKRNMRLWLKSLWWYVHLTESGDTSSFDIDATRELLKDNSQDIIYLLLDHVGEGFRDALYHELMSKYKEVCDAQRIVGSKEDFFRAIMLQHQISSTVVDPVLAGEKSYVDSLFARVLPLYSGDAK